MWEMMCCWVKCYRNVVVFKIQSGMDINKMNFQDRRWSGQEANLHIIIFEMIAGQMICIFDDLIVIDGC